MPDSALMELTARQARVRRRTLLSVLTLSAAALATGSANTSAASKLVIDGDFPDPDVLRDGGTYYAYSTNSTHGNVPTATAPAPAGPWRRGPDALPRPGSWATPNAGLIWAPDVSKRPDGSYLMYYTARDTASGRQGIGVARAGTPQGPFTPAGDGPLVCPADQGGAIDAASFTDTDGAHYLLYKNDGNAIGADTWLHLQRVSDDGAGLQGAPVRLLKQDRSEETALIEAPTLLRHQTTYVLMYSAGHYDDGSYFTGYARSAALTGPYTKSRRPLLSSRSTGLTGPGGQHVVGDGEQDWLVHHAVLERDPLVRGMYVRELNWEGDTPVAG